ncbi:MAG: acetylxylan esterase [Bacteroidales bacterium]|nr:acetylxylan esterase [Bacteroidales bacterium]
MKKYGYHLVTFLICFYYCSICLGQNIVLRQSNESGVYKTGEKARVTLFASDAVKDSLSVKIIKNYNNSQTTLQKIKFQGDTLVVFDEVLKGPTTVIFDVRSRNDYASIGLIVDPEKYTPGTTYPKDLKSYWKAQRKELRALPMQVKSTTVSIDEKDYQCFDVEINCTGPKPVRGYLAKPISAKPKSLPIVLNLHAAGVKGSWCRCEPWSIMPYAKMGNGTLCFDLNAHGMLNGQPEEYYAGLEVGELKDYYQIGLESKEDIYYRGMYLRIMRTLDYLCSLPEWDGKRIVVVGESQGGGQALAAAGLDERVTVAVATVPAMCDWGGSLVGRRGGWSQLFELPYDKAKMLATLPYFDTAHLLKGCKATIVAEVGLIDFTCPSSSIYAAVNQSKGKKIFYPVPYRAHHVEQPSYQKIWEETVYAPKIGFMNDYLK